MPHFIVIEGIDGSGTSTQVAALAAAFKAKGRKVQETFEPTSGPIGAVLREMLGGRVHLTGTEAGDRRLFAMLFAADRLHHIFRSGDGIKAQINRGIDVICARYVLSSFAYEGDDAAEASLVRTLNDRFPTPDLVLFLRCSVETALTRIKATRPAVDIFENKKKLQRVAANYEELVAAYAGPLLAVDATLPPAEITALVLKKLGM